MSAVPPVVLKASSRHTATLIFLHGLGDTGHGWASALQAIKPPHLKVVCPTAPVQPVTLNNGFRMPSWYDIRALDEEDYSRREDAAGVDASSKQLEKWIDEEVTADVPREKILIGGFSQGGAVAIYTTLRTKKPLGGCIVLSAYVPGEVPKASGDKCPVPVLQCHGDSDHIVPFKRGQQTHEILKKLVTNLSFHKFSGMGHESCPEEMKLVKEFIEKNSA